ncbi:hypothetical protein ACFFMP_02000 [Pseudoroseomonas cervicalis]|uniref:Uncharacterized protein n=1 Tax=Pseudoroseomonas cervicalis ATCC 49957 TaxID=525371 RepID=D5RME2_9PROT|nr:hypothetical protein [Pseudoroseomonas cervicalis]EFH11508.1 hypothetical protein HMPREF0731_2253 [Pseudoroseomonas cervicalis ATCC 49957]
MSISILAGLAVGVLQRVSAQQLNITSATPNRPEERKAEEGASAATAAPVLGGQARLAEGSLSGLLQLQEGAESTTPAGSALRAPPPPAGETDATALDAPALGSPDSAEAALRQQRQEALAAALSAYGGSGRAASSGLLA